MRRKVSIKQRRTKSAKAPENQAGLLLVPQIIGYARVSTEDQIVDVQLTALKAAGCEPIFVEKVSAVAAKRPEFNGMMKYLERGDTLIVHSLSRLGRDVDQILGILKGLERDGISWRSITEPHLDPKTAAGRLMINVTSSMAQFERDQIRERTKRGMDECKRKGMYIGAPRKVTAADAKAMRTLRRLRIPIQTIAERFKVSAAAVYSHTK